MKGTHTGLSGTEYDYESVNTQPGRAPDSIWLAVEDFRPGLALVALVGFERQVGRFARRVGARKPHPVAVLTLPDLPAELEKLAVTFAGLWPNDVSHAIVTRLAGERGKGWRHWAREYSALLDDPARVQAAPPSPELAKELAGLFLQQCARMGAS